MYQIRLEQFEGPLDLLLQLIEEHKLPITELALSRVTEDYLRYIAEQQDAIDLRELADFLAIAAKLLLMKSRELLPLFHWDDESDSGDLERQLKMYQQYWQAAKKMRQQLLERHFAYTREKPVSVQEVKFSPPAGLATNNLRDFFAEVLQRLEPVVKIPRQVIRDTISIQQKIQAIRQALADQVHVSFKELVQNSKDKTEVIVSFLAILELVKQRVMSVSQADRFGDIMLERIEMNV